MNLIDLEDKREERTDDKEVPYCATEFKAKEYSLVIAYDILLNTCMDIGMCSVVKYFVQVIVFMIPNRCSCFCRSRY